MVTAVVFEFCVKRYQPLRRALVFSGQINKNAVGRQNEK